MSAEDLEKYETEMELSLYREYKDIVGQFTYVVETERRFYLANAVEMIPRNTDGEVYFELRMSDAWVWDMYRPARFVKQVRVITFKDVNIEELEKPELRLPTNPELFSGEHLSVQNPMVVHRYGRGGSSPTAAVLCSAKLRA